LLVHIHSFLEILVLQYFQDTKIPFIFYKIFEHKKIFTFTLKLHVPTRTDFSSSCHCNGFFVLVPFLIDDGPVFSFFRLRILNVRLNRSIGLSFFGDITLATGSLDSIHSKWKNLFLFLTQLNISTLIFDIYLDQYLLGVEMTDFTVVIWCFLSLVSQSSIFFLIEKKKNKILRKI
jgi:hypothetical protein